jgi:hypothetical protein
LDGAASTSTLTLASAIASASSIAIPIVTTAGVGVIGLMASISGVAVAYWRSVALLATVSTNDVATSSFSEV